MKPPHLSRRELLQGTLMLALTPSPASAADPLAWPEITSQTRPWTRWWWLGSAVNEREITRHLELFHNAGLGGVEVSPIYGVKNSELPPLTYLSEQWVAMLRHTITEAGRLKMGVDMILGSGWPFGGPWVTKADAAQQYVLTQIPSDEHGDATRRLNPAWSLQALSLTGPDGSMRILTQGMDPTGKIVDKASGMGYTFHALQMRPTGQQVKRSAPGGEGLVLDHFSGVAVQHYLQHFEDAVSSLAPEHRPRCVFNDSYEVYGANWTPQLLEWFRRRRGYDLRDHLHTLSNPASSEFSRVCSDYRQTVAELLLNEFTRPWTEWSHRQETKTRSQAHGSPGNLLDLYAAADIPETEIFRSMPLAYAGVKTLPGTPSTPFTFGEAFICKLASSAAHVAGKPLCSAESMTWLGEHFQVPLQHAKVEADFLFLLGINHLFFHGTPFSPENAPWPGWLFYASTEFCPANPWWRHLPALTGYIARCQSFLQVGRPSNDVLLYFPIWDLWAGESGGRDLLQPMQVHNTEMWLDKNLPGFKKVAQHLWEHGWSYDCVSDDLLETTTGFEAGKLATKGADYRVLLVAGCDRMPPKTLERILKLARDGATLLFHSKLPSDVPGLANLDSRLKQLHAIRDLVGKDPQAWRITETPFGAGRVLVGDDLTDLLNRAGVQPERMRDRGLHLIRRERADGTDYFIVNYGASHVEGWIPISTSAASAALFDPATGRSGMIPVRQAEGKTQVYLQLEKTESRILRTFKKPATGQPWHYHQPGGGAHPLTVEWHVEFIEGGPELPPPASVRQLASWTEWPGGKPFSGTARYRTTFSRPDKAADAWHLELGTVCHSARVRVNGQDLGTVISAPWRVEIPASLIRDRNELEIEVTNLGANRIAEVCRRKEPWKRFYFVNIAYKDFDASTWEPLPSGLLGPVQLVPLKSRPIPAAS